MQIERISASSYKTYYECSHKYFIDQHLKHRFPNRWKNTDIGTITHAILEHLAVIKIAHQDGKDTVEDELGTFNVDLNVDIEGLCNKAFEFYIPQFPNHEWLDKDLKTITKYVNNVITHNNGQFNPLKKQIVNTERRISLPLEHDWARLPNGEQLRITGFIDMEWEDSDGVLEIVDWKTGKNGKDRSYEEIKADIQLALYHYALNKMIGDQYDDFLVTIFYLQNIRPVTVHFTKDDMKNTEDRIRSTAIRISEDNLPERAVNTPSKKWMCTKICEYGMRTFEDTNTGIKPQDQFIKGGVAKIGEKMTICDQCNFELMRNGMPWVVENMKRKDED